MKQRSAIHAPISGRKIMELSVSSGEPPPIAARGPFSLACDEEYQLWRTGKLRDHPAQTGDLIVSIADPARPSEAEIAAISSLCQRSNMAVYRFATVPDLDESRACIHRLTSIFGLRRFEQHRSASDDGIVAIEVSGDPKKRGFIPYTTRLIGWHTDGYYRYEGASRSINAMVLHCMRSAAEGGESAVFDHEIAYIRLRDLDPRYIEALMHPEAMTIPPCQDEDGTGHPAVSGPVFSVDPATGALHMRFTARARNIVWRDDPLTLEALGALMHVLAQDPFVFHLRLEPGWGVICNNVLHRRTAFTNGGAGERLLWRIRSYDRISGHFFADGPMPA
jgi:alpha-ketoglutarate-dependent taurine dioxygenase